MPGIALLADHLPRVVRIVAAAIVVAILSAVAAQAHAEFRGSEPAANAVLQSLPARVTLQFSEPVGVLTLSWLLPGGTEAAASARAGPEGLIVDPPPDAGRGSYALRWRVASTDGHPVGGALVFSVGAVSGAGAPGAAMDRPALTAVVLRGLMVTALVLSVGAAVFQGTVAPLAPAALRMAAGLGVLVLPLGALWLGAEGLDRLGLPLSALFRPAVWAEALHAPARASVMLAALAALLAITALVTGTRAAAFAAWALVALSFAVSGHALSAPTRLALPLTFLHGAALLFWVGSLLPLAMALVPPDATARAVLLRRFSRPALLAVIVLIVSGAGLILIRPVGIDTLSTPWAQLLAAKLVLVAVMLALGLWHRFRATPRLAHGADIPVPATVRAEALIGILVLCLAMGFRLAPPPVARAPDPPRAHLHAPRALADIELSAAPPGAVSVHLVLADARMGPLDPLEVRLALTDPAAGIGPLTVRAARQGPGLWDTPPITLPSPGPWTVRLILLISDFEQITLTGELNVKPAGGP